jgi:hypothetical protein
MTGLTDWFINAWNTAKNAAGKLGDLNGKAAPIIDKVCNFISYLPGKLGTIGKTIHNVVGVLIQSQDCYKRVFVIRLNRTQKEGRQIATSVQL